MFKHQIRVAYRDVTVGNHIYYSRYLDLLEITRNEAFREWGFPLLKLQEQGIIFPVVECNLRYHAPARYDDLVHIEMSLSDLGKIQLTFDYSIKNQEKLILTAQTRHAATSLEEKPLRIPNDLHAALASHLQKS